MMRWTMILTLALVGCAATAKAPPRKPPATAPATAPAELTPAVALSQAISMLSREARQAKTQQKLPRESADFAAAFPGTPDPEALGLKIIRPVRDDPFIDAYARWQLTSFTIKLPSLDDDQFQQLVDNLPAVIDNPRADNMLITHLSGASQNTSLGAAEQQSVSRRIRSMEERSAAVDSFNRAPIEFRRWVRERMPQRGERAIALAIEECTALLRAGYSPESAKARLDELCAAAGQDRDLDSRQRDRLGESLLKLSGMNNLLVRNAAISNNALTVEYQAIAIDDFEVRKWVRALEGLTGE